MSLAYHEVQRRNAVLVSQAWVKYLRDIGSPSGPIEELEGQLATLAGLIKDKEWRR